MRWYVFLILFLPLATKSIAFVYPVASIDNGNTMLLIYQKSLTHIELWFWNPKTKHVEPGLWSLFNPAGLQLLPNQSGFSFIDNGRIRIKEFCKRSPKSIELDCPLHHISIIHWIDNDMCYLSAKKQDTYAIFQTTTYGTVDCVVESQMADCMYPQKISNQLFYIERSTVKAFSFGTPYDHYRYCIKTVPYPAMPTITKQDLDDPTQREQFIKQLLTENEQTKSTFVTGETIVNFDKTPIAFLTMVHHNEGFVVEHPPFIENKNETIVFAYHRIRKDKSFEVWDKERLFSFSIPAQLLITNSTDRLYESLLPLLPQKIGDTIYFVDSAQNNHNSLNVFAYDLTSGKIMQKTFSQGTDEHYFVPCIVGNQLCIGGSLSHAVTSWIDDHNGMCVELLYF